MDGPFENRDFRRLFAGRVVTNVGDSFYFVAAMWLVYELTGDPLYSGVAGFLTLGPSALQFLAGPLVDRWPLRETMTATQVVQAVVVLVVPAAASLGVLSAPVVLVVMPLLSLLNQLVYPAQSAALPRLLDDEDLVAANSAFSVAYQGIDAVANAVGGVVIALVGGVALFTIDSVSFLVAALLFATVAVPPAEEATSGDATDDAVVDGGDEASDDGTRVAADGGHDDEPGLRGATASYLADLREGFGAVRGTFFVSLLAGVAVVNFAAGMSLAAMPAYADTLGAALPALLDGAGAYGILMAGFAAGNLLGAVGAPRVGDLPIGRFILVGFSTTASLWAAAIAVDWLPATAALVALALVPVGAYNVQMSALLQSAPPERLVGRVSSVLGSASAAAVPVGSLAGGAVAGAVGPRTAMWATAVGFGAFVAYVAVRPSLRRLPVVDEVTLEVDGR